MAARRVDASGTIESGRTILAPVAIGSGRDEVGLSVTVNAPPSGAPFTDARVTLSVSTPVSSNVAFLSLDACDVLEDLLRDARADLVERAQATNGGGNG